MVFVANRQFILFFYEISLIIFAVARNSLLTLCQLESGKRAEIRPQMVSFVNLISILFIEIFLNNPNIT
jgi:hypothetical protein